MTSFLARVYAFSFFDRFILIFPLYTVMFVDAGMTPVEITLCLTAWSAVTFMLQVPSGVVADRWSRRQLLAWAQLVRGVGFGVWLLYPHLWGFLVGLLLWGVKTAFTSGTFEALLYDELKAEGRAQDYTRIFGRTRAIQSGGVLLAALGAAVAARFGYGAMLIASLVSVALCFAAALSLPRAPRALVAGERSYLAHLRLGLAASFREPAVLSILVFSAIVLALGAALEEFWPIFGVKVGLSRSIIAVFVGAQNGVEVLVSLAAYRLSGLPTRGFYALFAVGGLVLAAAAGLFTPSAMLLLALYSGPGETGGRGVRGPPAAPDPLRPARHHRVREGLSRPDRPDRALPGLRPARRGHLLPDGLHGLRRRRRRHRPGLPDRAATSARQRAVSAARPGRSVAVRTRA